MGQIAGTVYLRIDGKLFAIGDGVVTFNLGLPLREAVMASDGPAGHATKPQAPSLEVDLIHRRDLDVEKVLSITDTTVTADLANGQTFVLVNAWWASPGDITSDGKIEGKFQGMRGELVRGK